MTGQKVWSSYARFADWGIALVRTDRDAPPHKGISMLAIPMTAKGVEVRPLRQITGDSEFNEVFLDDVEVPVEYLIGRENEGWRVANTTLANERGATFVWKEQVLHEVAIDLLSKACARRGCAGDALVRQRLAQSWIEVEIFRLHNQRTLTRLARGEELGSESSIVKLFWAGMSQRSLRHRDRGARAGRVADARRRARSRRGALGARPAGDARELDHGRHERDPAKHHRRASARPAARAGSEAKRGESMNAFADRYGPWALVAGASDGIGSAYARAMAERGCNVVLLARREALLDEAIANLADGPTWFVGEQLRQAAQAMGSMTRSDAVRMMLQHAGGIMRD